MQRIRGRSRYIVILFGRARRSDDVDFILEDSGEDRFVKLCTRAREASSLSHKLI